MGTEWSDLLRKASEPEHTLTLSNPGFHVQAQLFQKCETFVSQFAGRCSFTRGQGFCQVSGVVLALRTHSTKSGNKTWKLEYKIIFEIYFARATILRFRMVGMGMVYELSELKRKCISCWLPSFEVVRAPLNEKLDKTWVTNYVIIHPKYLESLISTLVVPKIELVCPFIWLEFVEKSTHRTASSERSSIPD